MAIPFIRVGIKKIDKNAFRWEEHNDTYHLVVLTQNFNHNTNEYDTSKINIMEFNGLQNMNREYYDNVDARVTDKFRRLQFLLIPSGLLFGLCPVQQNNPLDTKADPNTGQYNQLEEYAQWHYEESLRDLSLYCRQKSIDKVNGKISRMKNSAGESVDMQFTVQLLNTGDATEGNNHMKNNIWAEAESAHNEIKTRTGRNMAIRHHKNQRQVAKRNHVFQSKYFSSPRNCAICSYLLWGIMKEQGYECTKCGKVVHGKCIHRVLAVCTAVANEEIYQLPAGQSKIEVSHNLKQKVNWSLAVKQCAHSGKQIYPFTSYWQCTICKKSFKQRENLGNSCGVDELQTYFKLKEIQEFKDQSISNVNLGAAEGDCIYQAVGKIKLTAEDRHDAHLGALANAQGNVLNKIGVDKHTQNQIKERKARSIKKIKDSKFNDFKIEITLGQGSFGKVLLARYKTNKSGDKWLAVKAIRKDVTLENYDAEAVHLERDCLALIDSRTGRSHPFLASAICTFHDPAYLYFVMELISGGDLMAYVLKRGSVDISKVRTFGVEILLGLRFLHRQKIVYRDMKLDNVMIGNDGHVRIADFGMVKMDVEPGKLATTFCGTPDYMAPEILQYTPYCFKVDVWATAIMLFELIEGFSPFQGNTEDRLFHAIKWEQPRYKYAKKIKPGTEIKNFLDHCLQKDPAHRYDVDQWSRGEKIEFFYQIS